MLSRIESNLRRLRRGLSRSEWLARLLKLDLSKGTESRPGLVLVQIDGLAKAELDKALQFGEMPFLRQLLDREHYRLEPLYSGVPSTTPAAQAELFYGVRAAVPGFNFMRRSSSQLVRMYEPTAVAATEKELVENGGQALLCGGSCYAANFTAGARESHFCPTAKGWGSSLRDRKPWVLALLLLANAYSFLRAFVLVLLEIVLAVSDFVRGVTAGRDLLAELLIVPSRMLIVILLRELITIGVKIDIARGLPVIHLNFLGFDEQAHRRGPSSYFAHWTLKGIDDAIARIWRAIQRSNRRDYDLWIYSDHGQQQVTPYQQRHGRPVASAVARVVAEHEACSVSYRSCGQMGMQLQRVEMFGGRRTQRWFGKPDPDTLGSQPGAGKRDNCELTVASLGPVAHVYFARSPTQAGLAELALALVRRAHIPMVFYLDESDAVIACTRAGAVNWEAAAANLLGVGHPFIEAVTADISALCRHKDAGDLILSGDCPGAEPLSFAVENGAHGGSDRRQTEAFTLLPADIHLQPSHREDNSQYCRLLDLRRAALEFLQREQEHSRAASEQMTDSRNRRPLSSRGETAASLRIMTYNVHSCIGMDGKLSPQRISRLIARYSPDIVALQELDEGRRRTDFIDQASVIAAHLGMDYCFHPSMRERKENYGNAILSRFPMTLVKAGALPRRPGRGKPEPRGAIWVSVSVNGEVIQFLTTHLGLQTAERMLQVRALLGEDWLSPASAREKSIICGDFNFGPSTMECRLLSGVFNDAQVLAENHEPASTFFGRMPRFRIDHVFLGKQFEVLAVKVPNDASLRLASDHLPLIVDVRVT